jgi:two-component sensor histidine kinase
MRYRSFPIRWHLAVYGILIVCPLLIVGVLVAQRYAGVERDNLQRQAHTLVREVTESIDQSIERHKAALQALSTAENLRTGNISSFYARARQVADALPGTTITLRNPDGSRIFVTSLPLGTTLLPTQDAILGSVHRKVVETRSPAVSNVYVGRITGGRYVAVELPVEHNGQVIYLLSIAISADRFLEILHSHLENSGWLMGVTGTDGRLIARSWDHERFVGQSASQTFLDNTKGQAGTFTSMSLDGVPVFNVYLRSPLTGWRIAAGIPTSMLEAPLYRSLTVLALMAGIGLTTSVLLALLYARFLAAPVSALRQVAVSFARREPVGAFRTGIQELDGVAKGLAEASEILKHRDQVQQSLINELNHRVKNTLATIQSIARQTRRRASSLDEFGEAFEGRLLALAKSHDTLTRSGWVGGDLESIVLESCRPFSDPARVVLSGPRVEIPNRVVVGIGMVLHELATNAAKYGAFAAGNGTVHIEWRIEPGDPHRRLHLRWKERGGPPVVSINKKGFGSTLIVSIVESDLGGKAEMAFESDGLRFDLAIPLPSDMAPPLDLAGNGSAELPKAAE